MSENVDLSSEYLSFGYCRHNEKLFTLSTEIPDCILKLVHQYNATYIIMVNGKDHFGVGDEQTEGGWMRMKQLESLLPSTHNMFINDASIFVMDTMHNIYAAGYSKHSRLGISADTTFQILIKDFTKVCGKQQSVICSNGVSNLYHTFIYLVDDNKLYANGKNQFGQFGNGRTSEEQSILSEIEPFWSNDTKLKKIVCADTYSLFLMENGDLYGCGGEDCEYGLNPQPIYTNVEDMAAGSEFHVILYRNGKLEVSDSQCDLDDVNEYFEDNNIKIKQISAGAFHAVVLSESNDCFTFGNNAHGQCGNGKRGRYATVPRPYRLQLPGNEYPTKMHCGETHSVLLTNKNNVYAFGNNADEQISTLNKDKHILNPYLFDKEKELELNKDQVIRDVFGLSRRTLIVADPS